MNKKRERPTMQLVRDLRSQSFAFNQQLQQVVRERNELKEGNLELEKAFALSAKRIMDLARDARQYREALEAKQGKYQILENELRWSDAWYIRDGHREPVFTVEASMQIDGSSYRNYKLTTRDYAVAKLTEQALKSILPGCEVKVMRKADLWNDNDNTWIRA